MDAHSLGLTEPDPRDDILGIDSARKAVILGRTLGLDCDVESVLKNTLSLLPLPLDRDRLLRMSPEMFAQTLCEIGETDLENYLRQSCVNYTNTKGNNNNEMNLKYVTVIDTESESESEQIKIELRNYPSSNNSAENNKMDWLSLVPGSNNILQFTTQFHPSNNPLIVQGSTGVETSVHSIMTDLHRVGVAINHLY